MSALAAFTKSPEAPRRAALRRLGARVWDEAGAARTDFDMGGGAVLLGHAHPRVEAAVKAEKSRDLNEAAAYEALSELAPCAEAVRFCAEESQALPAAINAARKVTGRRRVAVFGAGGDPVPLDDLAALIVDPMGADALTLAAAARLADAAGAVLIFDEGTSSFRVHERGAQGLSGVIPHLSVFGAAIANGRGLGAVAGHANLIKALDEDDLPSPREAALAACAATLQRLIRNPVAGELARLGGLLREAVSQLSKRAAADRFFSLAGDDSLPMPIFTSPHLEGLWLRESARVGLICISAHGLSAAHDESDIAQLVEAYRTALPILAVRGVAELMGGGSISSLSRKSSFA